uniref:Major facilitator superfamily (MFS) profile domain-containing protein n=1 Tax=Tetradesmus obliquus TaxID=3088 RepID=A0A383VR92_TETOB|eukprot:jgi/Sobl393_1/17891/SZX68035.1
MGQLNPPLLRTLLAACCCSLATGWLIGIWGGITAMPSFTAQICPTHHTRSSSNSQAATHASYYCMYNDQILSLSGSIIYLSALPALALAARTTHKYGRKPTMWGIAVLLVAGAALGAAAQNLAAVFASRALMGMAMGCSFQAPTMLLCEVLPRHRRGLGMYFYNIALSLGFLLSGLANMLLQQPAWGWRASVALLAAPGLLLAGLLPSISESPQVLLQHGKDAAAAQLLERIRPKGSDTSAELAQMRAAAARAAAAGRTAQRLTSLVKHHQPELVASLLWPLVLMLTGLNVLSTWTPNLLMALGAAPAFALRSNTVMMAVGLAAALLGTFVVERVGRRTLLAVGGSVIAASMALLAVLLAAVPMGPALLPVALVLLCMNRVALTCTLQPLAATVPAEVQPLQVRADTSSLTTGMRNGSSFFVTQFALPLLCAAEWGLFLIFAGCTAVGTLALFVLIPETRGLPIEEVHLAWASHWLWGRIQRVQQRTAGSFAAPAAPAGSDSSAKQLAQHGSQSCQVTVEMGSVMYQGSEGKA